MNTLTLPNLPEGFGLYVVSSFGDRFLTLEENNITVAQWRWTAGKVERDDDWSDFEIPPAVQTAVDSFVAVEARYEWAERAHAPRNDGEKHPACGSSSASHSDLDTEPVVSTEADLSALPDEMTCWECRSIVS